MASLHSIFIILFLVQADWNIAELLRSDAARLNLTWTEPKGTLQMFLKDYIYFFNFCLHYF